MYTLYRYVYPSYLPPNYTATLLYSHLALQRNVIRQIDLPDKHLRVHVQATAIAVLSLTEVIVSVLRDIVVVADSDHVELVRAFADRWDDGNGLHFSFSSPA